jgi:hypothetical protein
MEPGPSLKLKIFLSDKHIPSLFVQLEVRQQGVQMAATGTSIE